MSSAAVLISKEEHLDIITLNRPQVLNAMNSQLVAELDQAITGAEEDEEVRAVIVIGAGERAFSAGGDIHEQRADALNLSKAEQDHRYKLFSESMWHLASCVKPTICAMNGLAHGGGALMASTMDIRVGCERASFRFLAASYGRINSTWTLPILVGWPIAKELLFTGREVDAEEAYRIGLLNHLVPSTQLMEKAREIGRTIANNHPDAVQGIKRLLIDNLGSQWSQMNKREREFITSKLKVLGVEEAFKDFLSRKGPK